MDETVLAECPTCSAGLLKADVRLDRDLEKLFYFRCPNCLGCWYPQDLMMIRPLGVVLAESRG